MQLAAIGVLFGCVENRWPWFVLVVSSLSWPLNKGPFLIILNISFLAQDFFLRIPSWDDVLKGNIGSLVEFSIAAFGTRAKAYGPKQPESSALHADDGAPGARVEPLSRTKGKIKPRDVQRGPSPTDFQASVSSFVFPPSWFRSLPYLFQGA